MSSSTFILLLIVLMGLLCGGLQGILFRETIGAGPY